MLVVVRSVGTWTYHHYTFDFHWGFWEIHYIYIPLLWYKISSLYIWSLANQHLKKFPWDFRFHIPRRASPRSSTGTCGMDPTSSGAPRRMGMTSMSWRTCCSTSAGQFWRCLPFQRCKICKSRHQVPLYNQQLRFLSITVNVDNFDSRILSRPSIAPNLGMSFQRFAVYKAQLFFPVAKISLPGPASCSQVAMIDTFLGKYIHLYIV